MSHELRTPLTAINGWAETMHERRGAGRRGRVRRAWASSSPRPGG
ncbi:MAG: histidine kinase dimerization/phospho-acceptor domain-containing protein [Flavonifractor plautii]